MSVSGANRINGVHLYSMWFAPLTDILQSGIFLYDEFWFRLGRVRTEDTRTSLGTAELRTDYLVLGQREAMLRYSQVVVFEY